VANMAAGGVRRAAPQQRSQMAVRQAGELAGSLQASAGRATAVGVGGKEVYVCTRSIAAESAQGGDSESTRLRHGIRGSPVASHIACDTRWTGGASLTQERLLQLRLRDRLLAVAMLLPQRRQQRLRVNCAPAGAAKRAPTRGDTRTSDAVPASMPHRRMLARIGRWGENREGRMNHAGRSALASATKRATKRPPQTPESLTQRPITDAETDGRARGTHNRPSREAWRRCARGEPPLPAEPQP
jgi:hypothetical protein